MVLKQILVESHTKLENKYIKTTNLLILFVNMFSSPK